MPPAKHIGIVAVSAEGAAIIGPHNHPQLSMHTYPLSEYMRHIDADRWEEAGQLLLESARKLVAAGAEILICPDNTAHQALDLVRDRSPVPWLHIAEEVSAIAATRRFQRLGILGTRQVIGQLEERGCDAVVLGCTEIPLLISQEHSPLPVLDSTRTLARAALREATREIKAG